MADETLLDDPTILDTDRLFRRISPNQIVADENGAPRPSTAAFKDPELSVNIESLMIALGRVPPDLLTKYPGFSLASIQAGDVRSLELGYPIVKDTEPPNDPDHGLVLGKKGKGFFKPIARQSRWVIPPPEDWQAPA